MPANNPFVGQAPALPEIWSYGLRNPWRFSFDRVTGDLNIGDVGQDDWEEIDYQPINIGCGRGVNFGWRCREGRHLRTASLQPAASGSWSPPVFEYSHSAAARGCSITGGYVVRDQEVAEPPRSLPLHRLLQRRHLLECARDPRRDWGRADTGSIVNFPTSFGEDSCGHVYVAGQGSGDNVFRIRQTDPPGQFCIPQYDLPVLTAHVDDNFTIHLTDPNGQ